MNTAAKPSARSILTAMEAATDPIACLELASEADKLENHELTKACLQRAVALDQRCQPALLNLAAMAFHTGQEAETFIWLAEASRIAPLPPEVAPMLDQLYPKIREDGRFAGYLNAVGLGEPGDASPARSIVVLAPQCSFSAELAGDGWDWGDLARALAQRGHAVHVLTAQSCEPGEPEGLTVHRKLVLPEAASAAPSAEYAAANAEAVLTVCAEASAELLLAGDLTGLDAGLLAQVTARGVSVLHAPADIVSGVAQLAKDRRYHLLAAGEWAGERWKNTRTDFASLRTLTPGFRLARHYRLLLPDLATLRLAVVVRFSAPEALQTVVNCLAELRRRHVDFQAEIVSLDNPSVADQAVLAKRLKEAGLAGQADYTGVWDALREETLLARSNVLVTATGEAECFPWRQLRAMAGGLVVVSENLGGTAGVVRSGEDGWLYAPGDEAALTAHLLALIKDAPAWVRLQRAAQARASEFSAPAVGLRLENLATQLLEQAVEPNVLRPASTAGIGAFLARYQREIGGVTELADVSMLALTGLCALQNEVGDRGDMMETGVFRAGTASLLASFLKPEERIFLVDPYQNVENNRRTILGFSGVTNAQLHFHTLDSVRANKRREQVFGAAGPDLRLVHIDGEHSYDAVFSDLDMATHFLAPGGLIVLDDIFALDSACCTHAMFDYLRQNPTVHCVAMGYRKAYLCESRHLLKYRRFFLNLPELASTVLGANVRVCFNDFGLERGYLTFSDCRKGEPRYQVIGKRFYQLREAAAAMGIAW